MRVEETGYKLVAPDMDGMLLMSDKTVPMKEHSDCWMGGMYEVRNQGNMEGRV